MEVLSRMSIDSSKKLEAIQKQILFLDSKLQTELKIKEKVEFDLYQKSKKRLNKLFAFILGQVFAV